MNREALQNFLARNQIFLLFLFLESISIVAFFYFFQNGHHLLYADALSRLNIARKVIDNLTPGLAQLGNVWLPLPQVLMLPFVWNDYLWHSGIAGYIMSGTSFIIGGIFIYKTARLLTSSSLAAFFAVLVYALNMNSFYLQTTAMSESIFMTALAASVYYFIEWFLFKKQFHLILAALSVSAMTLIRYEGLAFLAASLPMVFFYSYILEKKYHQAESNIWIYAMAACLGFALWTIYLTAIFGDPLYWKNFYASSDLRQTYTGEVSGYTQNLSFFAAFWKYFTSIVWMTGLIPVILALFGSVLFLVQCVLKKSWLFLPVFLPISIFLFMILTLQRNTPLVQPSLSWANIFSDQTSMIVGFNIRYGILLLPWIAIMSSFLISAKKTSIRIGLMIVYLFIFSFQLWSSFGGHFSLLYKIPDRIENKRNGALVEFMKQNYDQGYIMASAAGHEDQMFQMGFDYRVFIHEGTNKYWKESFDDPPRYASWVIIDKGQNADKLAQKPGIEEVLKRDYTLVFQEKQAQVYKLKRKPYFEIK